MSAFKSPRGDIDLKGNATLFDLDRSTQIQERITALLTELPYISQADLMRQLAEFPGDVVAVALNDMLKQGRVAAQQQGNSLVFQLIGEAERSKFVTARFFGSCSVQSERPALTHRI